MNFAVQAALRIVPELRDALECRPLHGGLTNQNFYVRSPAGEYVVRLAAPDSRALEIDRDAEFANSTIAASVDVGAPVVGRLPDLGVLVVGFLHGRTLGADDVRDERLLPDIAATLRRLHAGPPFVGTFDMLDRQRRYQQKAVDARLPLPDNYLTYNEHARKIGEVLALHPRRLRPCHNDVVAENLIQTEGGLRLVDYDYAGNNDPCYDLAETWTESQLAPEQMVDLVGHYFGEADPSLVARSRLLATMSKYGWSLWALLRVSHSPDDAILEWGLGLYRRAVVEFESTQFDEFLHAAAQQPAVHS